MTRLLRLLLLAVLALAMPLSGVAHAATTTVTPSNSQGFSFAETRATGHYDFTDDGLHIYTEGATSTDKVAAYRAVTATMAQVAADQPSLTYTATTGPAPGYQLYVQSNDGGPNGYLVGEPAAYGDQWWATGGKDFGVGGGTGCGYTSCAPLSEYLRVHPGMTVHAIGFSLGSGVLGDGLLTSLTFLDTEYTFAPDPEPEPEPTTAAPTTTDAPEPTTSAPSGPTTGVPTPTTTGAATTDPITASPTTSAGPTVADQTSSAAAPVTAQPLTPTSGGQLAYTGTDVAWLIAGGTVLLAAGVVLTCYGLRRRT